MNSRLLALTLVLVGILVGVGAAAPAQAAAPLGGQVSFSSYLGGNDADYIAGIAVDAQGNIYIAGTTNSDNFPANGSFQSQFAGSSDVFVIKLSPDGQRVSYATYLGGNNLDQAGGIAVDAAGHAYVVGMAGNVVGASSKPFPVTSGAYGAANASKGGAFVTKLAPDGRSLVYSAIIGSNANTQGEAIAIGPDGSVTIAGTTTGGLPVVSPVQASYAGGYGDLFVTRLSAAGDTLLYSTYLGGSEEEYDSLGRIGLALDANGAAYVSCTTRSTDMPIKSAAQPTHGGYGDAYLASLSAAGGLRFATYLGGSGSEFSGDVVAAPWGEVIVGGFTQSKNFPQPTGRLFGNPDRNSRAFVTRLGASDGAIRSTALIADAGYVQGLALDTAGRLTVVGSDAWPGMPLTLPHQPEYGGVWDGFVIQLSGDGGRLIYSSFIGGDYFDTTTAVAARPDGGVVLGGATSVGSSPNTFQLRNPIQGTFGGGLRDAYVRALDVIHDVYLPLNRR